MTESTSLRLLGLLSDGRYHSGQRVAESLGCSRTAVWKHIEALRALGLEVDAKAGRGYQLADPLELLDADQISACLSKRPASALVRLQLECSVDSTNDRLLELPPADRHGIAMFAEHQAAGRGRRGRRWVSPYGRNLYLSLGWTFEMGAAELGCLPLLVALAACDALQSAGINGHGVKWPNDIWLRGRKLGGCLVELNGDASGPCHAVMGVGLNVRMPLAGDETQGIDQPWTDLSGALIDLSRNRLAGGLLDAILRYVQEFAADGFGPFRSHWDQYDVLAGREVILETAGGDIHGCALGIDSRGALRLQSSAGAREYTSGEVSLRHRET